MSQSSLKRCSLDSLWRLRTIFLSACSSHQKLKRPFPVDQEPLKWTNSEQTSSQSLDLTSTWALLRSTTRTLTLLDANPRPQTSLRWAVAGGRKTWDQMRRKQSLSSPTRLAPILRQEKHQTRRERKMCLIDQMALSARTLKALCKALQERSQCKAQAWYATKSPARYWFFLKMYTWVMLTLSKQMMILSLASGMFSEHKRSYFRTLRYAMMNTFLSEERRFLFSSVNLKTPSQLSAVAQTTYSDNSKKKKKAMKHLLLH